MRKLIAAILTAQAKRFLQKYHPKVVVVAGSAGKTSTTQAIALVLSDKFSVGSTISNYNTDVGVPCSIFGHRLPESLKNPLSWLLIMLKNELSLLKKQGVEVLVLEIGTDLPGEIAQFSWLKPDVAVVSAVAAEHMEFFKTLEAVAKEELAVAKYSKKTWINKRMVDKEFIKMIKGHETTMYDRTDLASFGLKPLELRVVGEHSLDAVVAALSVGREFGLDDDSLQAGAKKITSRPGRMQVLSGVMNSTLIDDTYNASPVAVKAALDYLYGVKAPQRIALLGNMNELGDMSKQAHIEVGEYCDPEELDLVVTLGPHANQHTAAAARVHGCTVVETETPYEAAKAIKDHLKDGAYVLLKGSQNKVFAEEAALLLLENPEDAKKLVRQNVFWKTIKLRNFGKIES